MILPPPLDAVSLPPLFDPVPLPPPFGPLLPGTGAAAVPVKFMPETEGPNVIGATTENRYADLDATGVYVPAGSPVIEYAPDVLVVVECPETEISTPESALPPTVTLPAIVYVFKVAVKLTLLADGPTPMVCIADRLYSVFDAETE